MAKFTVNFTSEALKYPISLDIIVPSDHMVTTDSQLPKRNQPYKTLYLLEGVLGNYSGMVNYSRIMPLAEDYNLAIVCIGGDNKWYSDNVASGENYAQMVVRDVVNFTRRVMNLSRKKEDTFIGGFSMGGYGALVLGLGNPDIFGWIIAMDSALNKGGVLESSEGESAWDLFTRTNYKAIFNIQDVLEYTGSRNDYEFLAEDTAQRGKELPKIFMACGTQDPLYEGNVVYRDKLLALGYDVEWFEFEGKHNYWSFDVCMEQAITRWLPLEDNFCNNDFFYYGPQASTQERNMPWRRWRAWYNVEAEEK